MVRASFCSALCTCLLLAACGGGQETRPDPVTGPPQQGGLSGSVGQGGQDDEPRTIEDVFGQRGEPLSRERLARIARLIRNMEEDPYHRGAREFRPHMLRWLIDTQQVNVSGCTGFFWQAMAPRENPEAMDEGSLQLAIRQEGEDNVIAVMIFHYFMGMAAAQLEGGARPPHDPALQAAGLTSLLRVYVRSVRERRVERSAFLDELIRLHDQGQLAAWHQQNVRCGAPGPGTMPPPQGPAGPPVTTPQQI